MLQSFSISAVLPYPFLSAWCILESEAAIAEGQPAMAIPSASFIVFVVSAFLLLHLDYAMIWPEPKPTPAGLIAINGVTPPPTPAPGSNGDPNEIRRRVAVPAFSPETCGFFLKGDPSMQGTQFELKYTRLIDHSNISHLRPQIHLFNLQL